MPHPLDANYSLLKCGLKHLDKTDKEYDVVKTYFEATTLTQWVKMELTCRGLENGLRWIGM